MTPEDLIRQIDSLPDKLVNIPETAASNNKRALKRLIDAGGHRLHTEVLPPAAAAARWAMTQPSLPRTWHGIVNEAIVLYQAHHRGLEVVRPHLSDEAAHKLQTMLKQRPDLVESQMVDLAIRHLYHSFATSQDGMVDT